MKCIVVCALIIQCFINVTISETTTLKPEVTKQSDLNPLADILFNGIAQQPESGQTDAPHSRVKRQYYGNPYYYGRYPYYPIPIPIVIGGFGGGFGFGRPGFGGRGFGFGRPGFGGFGGRGFGGFGGRGFGGFGGRGFGGFGGGRGGRG